MSTFGTTQFAQRSGIPAHTLRRLHVSGKLVAAEVTRGGHRRYDESQVEDAAAFVRRMKLLTGGSNVIGEERLDRFFAYLLGLVMADGNVLESGQVQLELKDEQVIADVAQILGAEVHPRKNRPMYRITVPRAIACHLVEYGVCRRKSKGFGIPPMDSYSFGCFLRGLYDGDGSKSLRSGRTTVRFHGHPKSMSSVQRTLMEAFGVYIPWVPDNRIKSGMLETSRKTVTDFLRSLMYADGGVCLERKKF